MYNFQRFLIAFFTFFFFINLQAQNIGIGSASFTPDPSAGLEIKFDDKGLLIPRLTEAEKSAIALPIAESLLIFNEDTKCLEIYVYGGWQSIFCPCQSSVAPTGIAGTTTICNGDNTTLTVQGGALGTGAVWKWYTVSCGGAEVGTGASIIVSPTVQTTYYVRAEGTCGTTNCAQQTVTVNSVPGTPVAGTHNAAQTQIDWNWNPVAGATGYKWNTVNNYNTATDLGATTSFSETGLTCETSYTRYLWAYNTCGPSATPLTVNQTTAECPWSCGKNITDARDNEVYQTVLIGSQCWMKNNLRYLPSVTGPSSGSTGSPYYYLVGYTGSDVNEAKALPAYGVYGILYNWPAATVSCPSGWHLPTDAEWKQMEIALGMLPTQADATGWSRGGSEGGMLKATGTTYWNSPNTGATNSSGFSGYGGDYRRAMYGIFQGDFKSYGYWWTASENGSTAWFRMLWKDGATIVRFGSADKGDGYSVRCILN